MSAKLAKANELDSPVHSMRPTVEDWHAKVIYVLESKSVEDTHLYLEPFDAHNIISTLSVTIANINLSEYSVLTAEPDANSKSNGGYQSNDPGTA